MSWTKRPQGSAAPPPGPERQGYSVPQPKPYGSQEGMMYSNYPGGGASNIQQQQYWQMPPPAQQQQQQQQQQAQYNQQYGQVYQHQDYPTNANQFYPQPNTYNNMNYTTQNVNNTQQVRYPQQNYYQNTNVEPQVQPQQQQQHLTHPKPNADSWEDNWDWGWGDDASKQAAQPPPNSMHQVNPPQQQVYNNANVIEESFATTASWNWDMDDKKDPHKSATVPTHHEPTLVPSPGSATENSTVPETSPLRSHISAQQADEVRSLNDREAVKERLPNLALGKRFHLDNLTPQWSIESQMSQESSDGLHTQSEETYRSENQSRNSSKSSPGLNTDNSNFNYSQPALDESFAINSEWPLRASEEASLVETTQSDSRRESHDELSHSLQELSLANHEKSSTDRLSLSHEVSNNSQEHIPTVSQPPLAVSPANLPPSVSNPPLQPPPVSSVISTPPISVGAPPSCSVMPPPNYLLPSSNTNPFKHGGPFGHKTLPKGTASPSTVQAFPPPPLQSTSLISPGAVIKVSQHNRLPVGFEANLETTPDNSERPDQPQLSAFRSIPVSQVPDNLEVAPSNDRNEYLQTAHLSSGDFGENTDFSRSVPMPGLRRMVVGQQESEYNQSLNISGDEPPPGLARMVPGQQNEIDNSYNQSADNYLDRHIDGQTTDNGSRPYRQADGQQTPDSYTQTAPSRVAERRPIGLDRMVPGEPSNDEYSQYQASAYAGANEQRVVTGVDHNFAIPTDAGPSDVREQNVDGSDYTEQAPRNPPRNTIRPRESNEVSPDYSAVPEEQQREITMEGENLQDLSLVSSTDISFSREQILDGADLVHTDVGIKTDLSDSIDHQASSSRRQSLNRVNTSGDDSERDRAFKSSPRRDKHKASKERDRDRNRDRDRERDRDRDKDGRYSRGDRKYDTDRRSVRDERRSEKDRRERDGYRERRDESPDARRHRRSTRSHRYETEDTDYYSDKERDRRRHREGSYTSSKPPRPEEKDRRYEERDRNKRYNTIERDRRYDEPRRRSDRYRTRDRDRYERAYRDIDPSRHYGNIRSQRDAEDPRRGEFSSPSRTQSREAIATDDDVTEPRRRDRDRDRRSRRTAEPFYDEYGSAYLAQRQQYEYYEQLRLSNPAAYMQLYKQLMAQPTSATLHQHQHQHPYADEFASIPYEGRQERGSVHSGRSSANGLKGNDTDLTTDMSLNLHLEESTVRSERMTPFRYSTAHIKGSIGSRDVVVVRATYPADGAPATVLLLSLSAALHHLPDAAELRAYPGPLLKGTTHKKSVIEYCTSRARHAAAESARDVPGHVLVWQLLALVLRQNGVVVGSDIAELLMKNTREYEFEQSKKQNDSRRGSSVSEEVRDDERTSSPDQTSPSVSENINQDSSSSPPQSAAEERAALDRLRELLIYGNRQEAIEWAMSASLWGHALALAAHAERRTRAAVTARFLHALSPRDPLHTLYSCLGAASCVADERWGDWRPHAAIILSNPSNKPEQDRRTLVQLGDSLASRGLLQSAQFCYLTAQMPFARHPLAPLAPPSPSSPAGPAPRLALLLADPRATTLQQFATNKAIFATEIYEYAMSLNQDDYVINELQVYKLMLACRLADCGLYERALAYTEACARCVTRSPRDYSPALISHLATLADRLKYHDPGVQEDPPLLEETDSAEPSPRHQQQWLDDVKNVANIITAESAAQQSAQSTPLHNNYYTPQQPQQQQYAWEQLQPPQYQQVPQTASTYAEQPPAPAPVSAPEPGPEYAAQYAAPDALSAEEPPQYAAQYDDWPRAEEPHQQYADPYWQNDNNYGGYGERGPVRRAPDLRSALRRRVHPKPERANLAFAEPRRTPPRAVPPAPRARPPPLSDLDIQLAHGAQAEADEGQAQCAAAGRAPPAGRLIGNTVEWWARGARARRFPYKPLVFGGTYPIDAPAPELPGAALRRDVCRSLDKFAALQAARRPALTYDVDAPAPRAAPHTHYLLSRPRTYDIDEPISLL